MRMIDVHKQFATEEACLDYLEQMRWPKGLCCVHCGVMNVSRITRETEGKNKRARIYQCLDKACGKQFSATSGTIFNDTHLPLTKWFLAIALICEAKKGISANQLKRHLGVNYRTAWHLAHRIREAMADGGSRLTGVVEADETYVGAKVLRRGRKGPRKPKDVVLGMVERGGRLRLIPVPDAKAAILQPVLEKNISRFVSTVLTDEHPIYPFALARRFAGKHKTICHKKTYGIGDVHTNTIENAFSLFKRGLNGSFHHVSIKHLRRYCDEFSYRFNRREEQERMIEETVKGLLDEKALPYQKLVAEVV